MTFLQRCKQTVIMLMLNENETERPLTTFLSRFGEHRTAGFIHLNAKPITRYELVVFLTLNADSRRDDACLCAYLTPTGAGRNIFNLTYSIWGHGVHL